MSTENTMQNEVFRKIKEISARTFQPRPTVDSNGLAQELGLTRDKIMPHLAQLKYLRLVSFNDDKGASIKLTLLGCTVKR